MLNIDDITRLFHERGHEQYSGEPVTQLEHALQTALLAEEAGSSDELITACLLHDLGHLLHDLSQRHGGSPTLAGVDDVHQYRVLPFLRGLFGPAVLEPIGLHVDAKRYLCARRAGYRDSLSADSLRSLALQGGVFDPAQAQAFESRPHWQAAVQLRIWDDRAKAQGLATPPLSHYLEHAARCALMIPATAAAGA